MRLPRTWKRGEMAGKQLQCGLYRCLCRMKCLQHVPPIYTPSRLPNFMVFMGQIGQTLEKIRENPSKNPSNISVRAAEAGRIQGDLGCLGLGQEPNGVLPKAHGSASFHSRTSVGTMGIWDGKPVRKAKGNHIKCSHGRENCGVLLDLDLV